MNGNTNELHVVFGTGPVGQWTMRALVDMGNRVRMVNRSGKADVPAGIEVVKADAYDLASAKAAVQGATAVYQCAQPAYHEWAEKFPPLQSSILEAAASVGAKLIICDNLYMYGDPDGKPITEDMPYRAHTRKGKVRQAMAEAAMAAHKAGKLRVAVGRASDFFGPFEMVQGEQLFIPALTGKPANLLGNPDLPHSFTYVKDFGRALAILGTHDEALGQAWIVPTAPPVTQNQLVKWVEAEGGKPVKARAAGKLLLSLVGLFSPAPKELVEMLYEFEKPFTVDSSRFERTFGMKPTPTADAIRETVGWFKTHLAQAHK
ncbi:MAG: NAD-dependent epimerase/dehydratase family protein [Chloroflexota bacterium]|nr:NAD-dependent epimerase/dehydratase family protein [Chloroflexota bacterium]